MEIEIVSNASFEGNKNSELSVCQTFFQQRSSRRRRQFASIIRLRMESAYLSTTFHAKKNIYAKDMKLYHGEEKGYNYSRRRDRGPTRMYIAR
jgi:hypothetical protein